jgi:two-component system nitrogen regulation sensor histidine kinase NtrY
MNLRSYFIVYLIVLHLVFAAMSGWLLQKQYEWLLAVEGICLLSFFTTLFLFRGFYRPLRLLATGADFLRESDFSTRLTMTGRPEMDKIIVVYNTMIDSLRDERLKLQEQHYLLQRIIDASPSGIIIFDFDGKSTQVNPAASRLLDIPQEMLYTKKLDELGLPIARELAALPVGHSVVLTLPSRRKIQCRRSEFFDRGFVRSFIVLEELTEELRRTERAAYEKVIRLFAHEVNNSVGASNSLLHSCLHYSEQLREEDRTDFETALNVAINRSNHLYDFVRQYADLIKLPPPRLQPCDVVQLLEHLELLFSTENRNRRIRWIWDKTIPLPLVKLDKAQMEQVFINICKNAIEAIGTDGTITIRTGHRDSRPYVSIEDTGHGIPADIQQHLFTPFFSTKEHGQGIGLTLIQEILLQHHFDFIVESEVEKFTRFIIFFS